MNTKPVKQNNRSAKAELVLKFRYGIEIQDLQNSKETSIYLYFQTTYNFKIKFKHFLVVLLIQMLLERENNSFSPLKLFI